MASVSNSNADDNYYEDDGVQATTSTIAKKPADNAVDKQNNQQMSEITKLLNADDQSVWRYRSWTWTCGYGTRHQTSLAWPPHALDQKNTKFLKTDKCQKIIYRRLSELNDVRRLLAIEAGYKCLSDALLDPDFNNLPQVIGAAKLVKSEGREITFELPLEFPCEEQTSCPCEEGDVKFWNGKAKLNGKFVPKCCIEMNFSEPRSFNADLKQTIHSEEYRY